MHSSVKSPPVNDNKQPPLKPQIIGLNQIIIGRLFSFITRQGIILDSYTPIVDYGTTALLQKIGKNSTIMQNEKCLNLLCIF